MWLTFGKQSTIQEGDHCRDRPIETRDPSIAQIRRALSIRVQLSSCKPRIVFDPAMGIAVADEIPDARHEVRAEKHVEEELEHGDEKDTLGVLEV